MTDREKYLIILDRFYRGRGGSLLTKDECEAMEYAIASIKTDLKYDLLYEGEDELCNGDCDNCDFVDGDYCRLNEKSIPVNLHVTEIKKHQSDFSDLVAIHTEGLDEEIRCTMCTNSMKSDRGCDGSCIVNDKMYKEVMDVIEDHIADADKIIEPTTKNNFVDGKDNNVTSTDCISRQEAIDTIRQLYIDLATQKYVIDLLKVLPSVTPQEQKTGHWINKDEKSAVCSCCNRNNILYGDFCKWCGAKIVEPQEMMIRSRKMEVTINISMGTKDYEFYNVPEKVGKAIITLLNECEKDDSKICSAESER